MIETLLGMPLAFWLSTVLIFWGLGRSRKQFRSGIGIPTAVTLLTVFVWYVGDVLYNDYSDVHFTSDTISVAWWQVAVFVATFNLAAPALNRWFNARLVRQGSQVLIFFRNGVGHPELQKGLKVLLKYALVIWAVLLAGAVAKFGSDFIYFLFPYFGAHPGPWVTSGLGGAVDSVLALANYLDLMVGSLFGVIAALAKDRRTRNIALLAVFLIWPYYIFDRTRKFILVVAVPGICAWVFLRTRGGLMKKGALLLGFFLLVNAWFGFIISNRAFTSVTRAFSEQGFSFTKSLGEEHQGLNMFEELGWITTFIGNGSFGVSWGGDYFANLVNPIPRALWPSKPTIGIDYAIARGMGGADTGAGVFATLSHGLVGQGVANFGLYLGPAVAALIMAAWAAWLSRIDLTGYKIGHVPLYGLGLILTFTMGRDITFLETYPFVFGAMICWRLNRRMDLMKRRRRPEALHLDVTPPGRLRSGTATQQRGSKRD